MQPARRREADRLLQRLLELPEDQRANTLDRVCEQDQELKSLVERLLGRSETDESDFPAGAGLKLFGVETSDFAPHTTTLRLGEHVGPFELVKILGAGGMATVYLAERVDGQFEQQVALKILDRLGDSRERFEQERQILASLDNPNIARLLDGGVTDDGVPYVAMEYIEGEPLLEYCDRRRLPIRERLLLFAKIADAVHEAHRRLIVHRDIKSANVLVSAPGVPKLLDFGIAKLLEIDALPHAAPATRMAAPMTPEYASPEQIRGGVMTVATDIYQLGYLLYLLLVGRSPYSADSRDIATLVDAIVHRQPILPSTRAMQPDESADNDSNIYASRSTSAARLRSALSGDLDRVILKALHKDADHRYTSASQFASDIRNILQNKPVIARPDSVAYRVSKFTLRHRLAVGATSIAVLAAIISTTVFTFQLAQETEKATLEAAKASEVSSFLVDLIELSEPERAQGREITVREVLDRAADRVDNELVRQPQMQATLQKVVGQMYRELGAYEKAEALLDAALAKQVEITGMIHPDVADIHVQRTALYIYQGRYDDALQDIDKALATLQAAGAESPESIVNAMTFRGRALRYLGEFEDARAVLEEAVSINSDAKSPDLNLRVSLDIELGNVELDVSNFDEARKYYRHAIRILHAEGRQRSLDLANAHLRLSQIAVGLGESDEAEKRAQASLEILSDIYEPTHLAIQVTLGMLSSIYANRGDFDAAEKSLIEQLRIAQEVLGPVHPETATVLNNYGTLRFRQDRYADAADFYRQSVEIRKEALGPEHPITGMSMSFEAYARYLAGDPQAETLFLDALAILTAAYDPGHRYIANVHHDLGRLYVESERFDSAEPYLRVALKARRKLYGEDNVRTAATKLYLGASLSGRGELVEAERYLTESRDWVVETQGEDSIETAHADLWLADWLMRSGLESEAAELFENAAARIRAEKADDHWLTRMVVRLRARM